MTALTLKKKKRDLFDKLNLPEVKDKLANALPPQIKNEAYLVHAITSEINRVPKLLECNPVEIIGALHKCAQYGLTVDSNIGEVYLIPFSNKKRNIVECQMVLGYKGLMKLAYNTGLFKTIQAKAVYSNDKFEMIDGTHKQIIHQRGWSNRGEVVGFYAVAEKKDGGIIFEAMSVEEVDYIKDTYSKNTSTSNSNPWISAYDEMGKKTVLRRLIKQLPVSAEVQGAIGLDEKAEINKSQKLYSEIGDVVDIQDVIAEEFIVESTEESMNEKRKLDDKGKAMEESVISGIEFQKNKGGGDLFDQ